MCTSSGIHRRERETVASKVWRNFCTLEREHTSNMTLMNYKHASSTKMMFYFLILMVHWFATLSFISPTVDLLCTIVRWTYFGLYTEHVSFYVLLCAQTRKNDKKGFSIRCEFGTVPPIGNCKLFVHFMTKYSYSKLCCARITAMFFANI